MFCCCVLFCCFLCVCVVVFFLCFVFVFVLCCCSSSCRFIGPFIIIVCSIKPYGNRLTSNTIVIDMRARNLGMAESSWQSLMKALKTVSDITIEITSILEL